MTDYYILVRQVDIGWHRVSTNGSKTRVAPWTAAQRQGGPSPAIIGAERQGPLALCPGRSFSAVLVFRLRGSETYIAPGAPQDFTATAGHAEVTLTWTAPESDGGSAITRYQYRHAAGSTVPTGTSWTDRGGRQR